MAKINDKERDPFDQGKQLEFPFVGKQFEYGRMYVVRNIQMEATLDGEAFDTIHCAKAEIQNMEGVPLAQQCWFLEGEQPEDGHVLSECNFQMESLIMAKINDKECDPFDQGKQLEFPSSFER